MRHLLVVLLVVLFAINTFAQVKEIAPPNDIKTITFIGNSQLNELPIIPLGQPLTLEFDVLNTFEEDYYYKITHYNADWTPSSLFKTEYLNGLDNQLILNFKASFNTFQSYTHYTLSIPNSQTKALLVSGNYMLTILNQNGDEVFSRKFMIYENLSKVGVSIKRSRNVNSIKEQQSVDILVVPNNTPFDNPKLQVKATIIQNNNLKTAINNLAPQYTVGRSLEYRYTDKTTFLGGNEFLSFENKNLRSPLNGVEYIELKDLYHNYLFIDEERAHKVYTYNPDINGSYLVTVIGELDPSTEADYAWVHFALKLSPLEGLDKKIYIYGNFNNFVLSPETELKYNEKNGLYETKLLLKQGFYNYKYVTVSEGIINEGEISGNFWQTENNYKVLIYYRDLGGRYDRVVGFGQASSVNIKN